MKIRPITYLLIAAMTIFAVSAFAEIRVTAVKGNASYKLAGKWQPLKAGVQLAVGTKVSTGVRSTVDIKINKHSVTVYPLTIMKISESKDDETSSTTAVGLRRGAVKTVIARDKKIKTVFNVSTPVATSSVRGSAQITFSSPNFGTHVVVLADLIQGQGLNGAAKLLSGDLKFLQKMDKGADESILNGVKDFMTNTHSLFISLDEQTAFELFGDDFQFYDPSQRGSKGSGVPVPVNIYLIWPQLP